ncbi:hypothetical protein C2S51_018452 [Perilla frutescens var. frutescens]|nr:hypothetical protein C2S51_018452 [Perilla frutescens var. frutescens]
MGNYLNRGYGAAALLDFGGETPIIRGHLSQNTRVRQLVCCAFFVWASVTPCSVVSKLLAASVVFGCFWLVSKLQHYGLALVYLRAVQLCKPLLGVWLGFKTGVGVALRMNEPVQFWIVKLWWLLVCYVGLMHVVLFSEEVVLRARGGDGDHVEHALNFYTDFPSFVVHLKCCPTS